MVTQRKLAELDSKFKIAVISGGKRVEAPLPPDFGFTVGSEYTTPFDTMTVSGGLQKLYAVGGISHPVGIRMRKLYANPEPTEISFDMEFTAFYSAKEEVVMPIIRLLVMGLGRITTRSDVEEKLRKIGKAIVKGADLAGYGQDEAESASGLSEEAAQALAESEYASAVDKLMGFIGIISSPDMVTLKFGDFITIDNAFITSTGVQFSNTLDKDGYPMSGKVSVTCTLQLAPVADDIVGMFGGIVGVK